MPNPPSPSSRPSRYFRAWMYLRCHDLIKLFMEEGAIPDGPVMTYARYRQYRVKFIAEYVDDVPAAPLQLPEPPHDLPDGEQHILGLIGTEWMHSRTIVRLSGYLSASHVRQLISNLCEKGLLERGKRGVYRRKA